MEEKKKILVVDDSEFVRLYHTTILQEAQFETRTAVDGSDALEKLYAETFDLVLTDVNMSNMDGYEFIRRVRADEAFTALPIIIVSSEKDSKNKSIGFEAGATLYLVKPCTPELMVDNIRLILAAA